jgi:hypothetical protein
MLRMKMGIKGKVTARVYRFPKGQEIELLSVHDSLVKADDRIGLKRFYKAYLAPRESPKLSQLLKFVDGMSAFRYNISENHNIVTDEGDALVADIMSKTPARTKVDGTNGYIAVGTGWTGTTPKANTTLNTPTGSPKLMTSPYPQQKGSFGAANDNVTQYRTIFTAGDLNASGINECIIYNNVTPASADALAYAQLTPSVNMTTSDTLQIDWELTFLGS